MCENDDFREKYDISYIPKELGEPNNRLVLKHCLCSYLMYFVIYLLLKNVIAFQSMFVKPIEIAYIAFFAVYVIFAPAVYFVFKPKSIHKSHSIAIFEYFKRVLINIFTGKSKYPADCREILDKFKPSYHEKQSLMLMFIKVFFGIIMVSSVLKLASDLITHFVAIKTAASSMFGSFAAFKSALYSNSTEFYNYLIMILFAIDVVCFAIGYLSEASFLKNKIRTVETNIFGVIVCLACYPPFNTATTQFAGWMRQNDSAAAFGDEHSILTYIFRFFAVICVFIYASASVALGTKASNLTNRGTVSKFPYNIVRHPAYISKNLFWLLTTIPVLLVHFNSSDFEVWEYIGLLTIALLANFGWAVIYYFRAITEEKHLMKDPEYREYMEKVKYRFIPWVF